MIDLTANTSWKRLKLDELFDFVIGGDWGKDPDDVLDSDYSTAVCIRGNEIRNWNKERGKNAAKRKIKKSSLEKRKLKEGDILLEISGGGPDQPVGRTVYIDKEALEINSEFPKVCSNFLRLVRLKDSVDKKFIDYYLKKFYITGEVVSYQGGSNNLRNLKFKDYSQIEIPLPFLNEQKQISTRLDEIFGYLDILNTRLDHISGLIKVFKEKTLTNAVTGKLTEKWRKKNKVMKEWAIEKAADCCEKVQSGGTPKKGIGFSSEGFPFLKVYNIVNQKIDFSYRPQFIDYNAHNRALKKSICLPGDVLMNIVGPPLGKVAIVPDSYPEWNVNQAITLFRPKKYLHNKFLYYFFCEGRSVKDVMPETRGVVGQINISLSQCREFLIPLPSLEEQTEIVNIVDSLFSICETLENYYNNLKRSIADLPEAALRHAFAGKFIKTTASKVQ